MGYLHHCVGNSPEYWCQAEKTAIFSP